MDKDNNFNNNINIKKKSFIIYLILVSFISIILLTTSIVSFTSNNKIPSVDAQTREPPPTSPSQLQAEQQQQQLQQQQQSSSDRITTQASSSTCNSIPIQFPISHPEYLIEANSLLVAGIQFKFPGGDAAETRNGDPQRAGFQLDAKGRITCASAVIIPIEIEMPSWTNVGTLCPEIQNEWSSFLSKVSAHEQLHVNFIQNGFADYGKKIVGKTLDQAVTIFNQMAAKVQKNHDSIDPSGISLNPNIECKCPQGKEPFNGQCVDMCPAGATRDYSNGQCKCDSNDEHMDTGFNRCVPNCSGGKINDPQTGVCTCPAGQDEVNGQCSDPTNMQGSFTVTRDFYFTSTNLERTSFSNQEMHMRVSGETDAIPDPEGGGNSGANFRSFQGLCTIKGDVDGNVYFDKTFTSGGGGFTVYDNGKMRLLVIMNDIFNGDPNSFGCETPSEYAEVPYTIINGFIKSSGSGQVGCTVNEEVVRCSDQYSWDITIPLSTQ